VLILVDNLQVHLLSNYAYYPGAKPRKKHALNKQYAFNSELRLLTGVYGSCKIPTPCNPCHWHFRAICFFLRRYLTV